MLIRAYADLHGYLPVVPPCDVLLLAGDICPISGEYGDHTPKQQARFLKAQFYRWCLDVPAEYIVLTPGNHDAIFEHKNRGFHYELPQKVALLIDEAVEIDRGGPRVFAQPWIPTLKMWPFYKMNSQLEELAEKLPRDVDIWMFHGPPLVDRSTYALDMVRGKHAGNPYVTPKILDRRPQLVVCGHIHEGFALDEIGEVPIANVAFVDEHYIPRHRHLEIAWSEDDRVITRLELIESGAEVLWSDANRDLRD